MQGHKRVTVDVTRCGFDSHDGEMKYLKVSSRRFSVKTKRGNEFHHSTCTSLEFGGRRAVLRLLRRRTLLLAIYSLRPKKCFIDNILNL